MTERKPPIECRLATVGGVNFAERIITVIAVPYEETASVEYRGEVWQERFLRGAFDGIQTIQRRVPVNLFHDARSYVGRVAQFFPDRSEGLVTELRIYPGAEGDRTLEVADDDGYSASIGFGVRGSDQQLDQRAKTRVIKRAFIDHVALGAFTGVCGCRCAVRAWS
jgi:phage head maturation protease